MKPNVAIVRVLVASPGDVQTERAIVPEIISAINRIIGSKEGFRLEQVLWEQDSFPDIGADVQDVINRQLLDYDIFLGIMRARFGTPTKRANSGTEEEFDRAYQRHLKEQNSIRILFYFCSICRSTTSVNDYSKLASIMEYMKRLKSSKTRFTLD
jgi:hypothetical protein